MGVVVELKNLSRNYPKILEAYEASRQKAIAAARASWGMEFGGFNATITGNSFGEAPIRNSFLNLGTTNGTTDSWIRTVSRGWNVNLFNQTTQRDVYLLIAGWIVPGVQKYVVGLRQTANGKQTSVIDFEGEVNSFETPVVVYPEGTIIPQQAPFQLDVKANAAGDQMLKPWGAAFAKVYRLVSLINATA